MKKSFDCVEMKRKGAERVQARLAGLTREEQLRYWEERGRELRALQQEVIQRTNASQSQQADGGDGNG
jgi:hypothetical protein